MARRHSSQEREERRESLLDAAVAVVRREGHTASMEAMARESGITKPILYRVFGDRDGLLHALGERFAAELTTELTAALDGRLAAASSEAARPPEAAGPSDAAGPAEGAPAGPAEPREILRSSIDAYLGLIERDPELYRFLTARLAVDPTQPITSLADQFARTISVVLGDQLRAVGADSGAAEPWAYALVGMVHLAGDWWVNRQLITRETLVTYLVQLVWDGLSALVPTEP